MYQLKKQYRNLINDKASLLGKVAEVADKDVTTIRRWVKDNNPYLTMANVLQAIADHTGDPIGELTELISSPEKSEK